MITFHKLLNTYGLNPKKFKLVRHSNKEINILDNFRSDFKKFEYYQSFQKPKKFSNVDHIAVFAPDKNTLARFLGIWNICGFIENLKFTDEIHKLIDHYDFPKHWHKGLVKYNLIFNPTMEDLSQRLIIDWGESTVSWVQSKDKDVVELRRKYSVDDFISYDKVHLTYPELKRIVKNPQSNINWVNALSNVFGIYLIRDKGNHKLYVGSAYGTNGIFGRWSQYANSGHGGNKELKNLNHENFEFSILELIPSTFSNDEVIKRETQWKIKLGTRVNGLNIN